MPFKNGRDPANKKYLDEKKVIELYKSGLSTNKIGKMLGCHKQLVSRIVKAHGLLRFRRMRRDQQAEMVRLYAKGLSAPAIAKKFAVTPNAVYLALDRAGVAHRRVGDYDYEEPSIRHDFFDNINSEESPYWLGFITGDGCVTNSNEIVLSVSGTDAAHIARWRKTIGSQCKLCLYKKHKQFEKYRWLCTTARLTIGSRRLVAALKAKGVISAKTGRTVYPSGIPTELAKHFWRGLVDADGMLFWGRKSHHQKQFVLGLTGDKAIVEAFRAFCRKHVPTCAHVPAEWSELLQILGHG